MILLTLQLVAIITSVPCFKPIEVDRQMGRIIDDFQPDYNFKQNLDFKNGRW
jgi:hypothetical protein